MRARAPDGRETAESEPAAPAPPPPAPHELLDLQGSAGNAAVARMLARSAASVEDAGPEVERVKSGPAGSFGATIEITPELIGLMGAGRRRSGQPDLPGDDKGLTYKDTPGDLYAQGAGDAHKIDPN